MAEPLSEKELHQIRAWLRADHRLESELEGLALAAGRSLLKTMEHEDEEVVALLGKIRGYNAFNQFSHDVQDRLNQMWVERRRRYDPNWFGLDKENP